MEKTYPYLDIPHEAKPIFERISGVFHGRADSDVYLDTNHSKLYKLYNYEPTDLSLYHALHDWCAENIQLLGNHIEPIHIDNKEITQIDIHILPLYQDQIFQAKQGTITTPTYIPGPNLTELIEKNSGNGHYGYAHIVRHICVFIGSKIGEKLGLYHPNFFPHISPDNVKYKALNNTLHLLITDIGGPEFGVYNLIREMKQHYGNPILSRITQNIHHNQTTHSHEIVQLFLQSAQQKA